LLLNHQSATQKTVVPVHQESVDLLVIQGLLEILDKRDNRAILAKLLIQAIPDHQAHQALMVRMASLACREAVELPGRKVQLEFKAQMDHLVLAEIAGQRESLERLDKLETLAHSVEAVNKDNRVNPAMRDSPAKTVHLERLVFQEKMHSTARVRAVSESETNYRFIIWFNVITSFLYCCSNCSTSGNNTINKARIHKIAFAIRYYQSGKICHCLSFE